MRELERGPSLASVFLVSKVWPYEGDVRTVEDLRRGATGTDGVLGLLTICVVGKG